MTKLEVKIKLLERLEEKNYYYKDEKNAYILGYLCALKDTYEITSEEYFELLEELIYD